MHIFGVLRPKRKGVKEYDLIVDSVMSGVEGDGILRGKVFFVLNDTTNVLGHKVYIGIVWSVK